MGLDIGICKNCWILCHSWSSFVDFSVLLVLKEIGHKKTGSTVCRHSKAFQQSYVPLGDVRVGRYRHLAFATPQQLTLLGTSNTWYVDATFTIVKPPFRQLFSIHAFVRSNSEVKQIPLAFALMSKKRADDYRKVYIPFIHHDIFF